MPERQSGAALALTSVSYSYPGSARPAVDEVDLKIDRGTFTAIIGPNGAGKSTIVRLLGGASRPQRGRVEVLGRDVQSWDRAALARRMAVVSQDAPPDALPVTVRSYVELGRNPYVSPWAPLADSDRRMVDRAMGWADLGGLEARSLAEVSGGERQRAKLARALAQEPDVLLLDEPSAHLDFGHAMWVFAALGALVVEDGLTVVCITHDMHLASRHAGRIVLLSEGRVTAAGSPGEVLTSTALTEAYGCEVRVEHLGDLGHYVVPLRTSYAARLST